MARYEVTVTMEPLTYYVETELEAGEDLPDAIRFALDEYGLEWSRQYDPHVRAAMEAHPRKYRAELAALPEPVMTVEDIDWPTWQIDTWPVPVDEPVPDPVA